MQKVTEVDTPFGRLARGIKRNPVVVGASVRFLEWRCRSVRSFAFVASTGRSGTTTLARFFEDIPSCVALHEPYPAMTSDYATDSADDAQLHQTRFQQVKRIQVLRAASNLDFYLETNHQFLKNFAYPAIDYFGRRLRVIHLRRDPVSVASSFFSIGSVPGKTKLGSLYLIDPHRSDNVLPIGDVLDHDPKFADDLYPCLWYWYEMEARVIRLLEDYPAISIMHLATDDLNQPDRVKDLLSFLALPHLADRVLAKVGLRTNQKREEKQRTVDRVKAQEMDDQLSRLLRDRFDARYIQAGPKTRGS